MTAPILSRRRLLGLIGLAPLAAGGAAAGASAASARPPLRVLWTRINGEHYYEAAQSAGSLAVGGTVTLRREPGNSYDKRAIEVLDLAGRKLGYIARSDNSAVARMMDAGERFEARIGRLDAENLEIRLAVDWLRG